MKGLLHSKRFRKNLSKWLFMYVGVMALFTTVVTYSRYITSQGVEDSAKVAKFDVKIIPDENITICENNPQNKDYKVLCTTDNTYRPTSEINYQFTVDTTDVEVLTDLVVTVEAGLDFKIMQIENLSDKKDVIDIPTDGIGSKSISSTIDKSTKGKTKYKVTIKYSGIIPDSGEIKMDDKAYDIVKVSYSAKQITNR